MKSHIYYAKQTIPPTLHMELCDKVIFIPADTPYLISRIPLVHPTQNLARVV